MGFSIRSNPMSLNTQKTLRQSQKMMNRSLERLSSGFRINKAADDAAGLAISENFRAQIKSFNQARRNANDGISMLQVAEGALNEISNMLTRMRELSVQASNDTLISRDRTFLNSEYSALKAEIDRISEVTEFNGKFLVNGAISASAVEFQIGIEATSNDRLAVTLSNVGTEKLGSQSSASHLDDTHVLLKTDARNSLDIIDQAINEVAQQRSSIGAHQNRLNSTIINLANSAENITAANSRIRDVDVAEESANMTRNQILVQAGSSMLAQANQAPQAAMQLLG